MKKFLFTLVFFIYTCMVFAQRKEVFEDIYQEISKDSIIVGNSAVRLAFLKQNGAWVGFRDEETQKNLISASSIPEVFDFQIDGKEILANSQYFPKQFYVRKNEKDDGVTASFIYEATDAQKRKFEFQLFYILYPESPILERSASVHRIASEQFVINENTHFEHFSLKIPSVSIGNKRDCTFDIPGPFFVKTFVKPNSPFDSLVNRQINFHQAPDAGLGIISMTNSSLKTTLTTWMSTKGEVAYQPFLKGNRLNITIGQQDFRSVYLPSGSGIKSDVQIIALTKNLDEALAIYQENVSNTMPFTEAPTWVREMTILEVYPKYFKDGFKEITEKLTFYKGVGFNTIYLMPHWVGGYSPVDLYQVDPAFGSKQDLQNLVKKAHELGMKVLFDMVIHGVSEASDYVRNRPQMFVKDEEGKIAKHRTWGSMSTDWSSAAYQQFMIDLIKHDIATYDIDGYRVDAATYKGAGWNPLSKNPAYMSGSNSPELLKKMLEAMRQLKPEAVFLNEVFGPVFHSVFNLSHDNQTEAPTQLLELIEQKRYTAEDYKKHLKMVYQSLPSGANRVFFARNHDTSWFFRFNGYSPRFLAFDAIHSFFGIPEFFAGDLDHEPNPDEKVYNFYQKVFAIRSKFPELIHGEILLDDAQSSNPMVFTGIRKIGKQASLVVISLSEKEENVRIKLKNNIPNSASVSDLETAEKIKVGGYGSEINLKLKPFQILVGRL
ncbi:MAG: alpha-amylase family glycosyl hydrolase [Spirosomataceae bacterium]